MTKTILSLTLLSLFCFTSALAQKIEPPKLTPTPVTENQRRLIKEGVALHDRGDYDGAIAKYEEVLRENPDSDWALYELGFSYQTKKDYRKCLDVAFKGSQYKSDKLSDFYMLIGNSLDDLGESKKALDVYKQAIKIKPDTQLLYFNIALTYARLKDFDESKQNLKKAVYLNPNHPSSHLVLAQVFSGTRYKTPALFAAMRFLVIEPTSRRAPTAYKVFSDILRGGASAGKNPNEINIFADMGGPKDEGDFGALELTLGLSKAAGMTAENKDKTEGELLVEQLNTVLAIVGELDPKGDKSKFTWRYYIPYFVELKKRNLVEPFAYYISQSSDLKGVPDWLKANTDKVNAFLSWSNSYQWPKE